MNQFTINVNISAPGLAEAILALAKATAQQPLVPPIQWTGGVDLAKAEDVAVNITPAGKAALAEAKAEAPADEPQPEANPPEPEEPLAQEAPVGNAPKYKLEDVRAKLTALSQAGMQAEVKDLIKQFGGSKLTDLPKESYFSVMTAAARIEEAMNG